VRGGYAGETIVMMAPSGQAVLAALGEVSRDLFVRLGINVDYVVSDWGTLVQRRAKKDPPAKGGRNFFHTTWNGLDGINPGIMQFLRANGEGAWFGWPTVPALEAARLAWFDAPELADQRVIANTIQRAVFEEAPYLPSGQYFSSAWRRGLTGVIPDIYAFWGIRPGVGRPLPWHANPVSEQWGGAAWRRVRRARHSRSSWHRPSGARCPMRCAHPGCGPSSTTWAARSAWRTIRRW
jgi:ABC-type transport system substrate-binding protein